MITNSISGIAIGSFLLGSVFEKYTFFRKENILSKFEMFTCGFQNAQRNYSSVLSFIPNSASICVYAFTLIIFYCLNLVRKTGL